MPQVPLTVDPVAWGETPHYQPWGRTLEEIHTSIENYGYAGVILHHDIMTHKDVQGLRQVLEELMRERIHWPTMSALLEGKGR